MSLSTKPKAGHALNISEFRVWKSIRMFKTNLVFIVPRRSESDLPVAKLMFGSTELCLDRNAHRVYTNCDTMRCAIRRIWISIREISRICHYVLGFDIDWALSYTSVVA